ncbi:MAG: twin-arginine translocase TatA/TatE family subunit [Planctomycetota bacterium]|nr:twin-arginine translocase TatA/TatE family subunit [Planctomycetota bacterium]
MTNFVPLAFFSMPGGLEWVVIGLVALLLFGKRLPGVAKSLGQALHEFRSGLSGESSGKKPEDEDKTIAKTDAPPPKNE